MQEVVNATLAMCFAILFIEIAHTLLRFPLSWRPLCQFHVNRIGKCVGLNAQLHAVDFYV